MEANSNAQRGIVVDKIDVIWKSYHEPEVIGRGYWDQAILEDMFESMNFEHHLDFDWLKEPYEQGAVVVINGRTHTEDTAKINEDIAKLRWVLFIETGDEESVFPWREIKHPIMRVWIQLPRMNMHDDVSFHLPNGYRTGTVQLLKSIGFREKTTDVFFAGQINHPRREQCVEAMKALPDMIYPNNKLVETKGFGQEVISQFEYLTEMAQAKIVLCPSGIESPDTFRLYEALEAGCLPIVDAFATNNQSYGFWNYLFDGDVPFPIISYWSELPKLLPQVLKEYPENANKCYAWWQNKKRDMKYKMLADIQELQK